MKKVTTFNFDENILKQFKMICHMSGNTCSETLEKFMKNYINENFKNVIDMIKNNEIKNAAK